MSARPDSAVDPARRPTVVDVVAPVAVDTAYSYRVPAGLALQPGDLVDVPLGTRETPGVVWAVRETAAGANLKAVTARRDAPALRPGLMRFVDWVARWTLSPRGMVLRMAIRAAEDLGPEMLLDLLGRLDEPFGDPAVVPTYALSKMTRGHVKVALSGDGGDEVFGGYPKYLLGKQNREGLWLQRILHQALYALPWRSAGLSHVYWRTLSSQDLIRWSWARYGDFPVFGKDLRQVLMPAYFESARVSEYFETWEHRAGRYGSRYDTDLLMRTDLETYLSENCLVKTDRASMLASLEVRVPFLDNVILDHILPLPAENKIVNGRLKALLLPIAHRILPKEVWDRPKQGFDVSSGVRLKGDWRPAVEAVLDWGEVNLDLFNMRYLRKLHQRNLNGGEVGRELWDPFVFLAWAMARRVTV